jgi:hypothetical protein
MLKTSESATITIVGLKSASKLSHELTIPLDTFVNQLYLSSVGSDEKIRAGIGREACSSVAYQFSIAASSLAASTEI